MEIDRWDVEEWAARSRMGKVCGIYGCPNMPMPEARCPHCGNNYCFEHRWVINSPAHGEGKK